MPIYLKKDKSVLFIHVPKTGGSSIEGLFRSSGFDEHDRDGVNRPGSANTFRKSSPQHWHAPALRQIYRVRRFSAVFTIVRHPVSRFQSEFTHRLKTGNPPLTSEAVDEWATSVFDRYSRDPFTLDNHLRPQNEFLLPEARVYRFEDGLEAAIKDLNTHFGLDLPLDLPHLQDHSKRNGGVRSQDVPISPATASRIRDVYAKDFEKFGYA